MINDPFITTPQKLLNKLKENRIPDFMYVGFPKTGSTWLYEILQELPEFSLPPEKEIHYFDRNPKYPSSNFYSKSYVFNRIINPKWSYLAFGQTTVNFIKFNSSRAKFYFKLYFKTYNDNWYLSLFNGSKGITGDVTPSYCLLDNQIF